LPEQLLVSRKNRVYGRKHSPTQPLTKITSYTLKRIAFTTSRASEMKARAKKAPSINLHSEKYIRILQMLETQLKRNRKENPLFYYSLSCLFSIIPPCSHDSHHLSVLYTSGHDYVILFHLHTSLLPIVPQTPNRLSSTPNTV